MKVVILAGGRGTRLQEETDLKPKPMVEIGGLPILWHVMKIYSAFGFNEFIICLGYKGFVIKQYFIHYLANQSDFSLDLQKCRYEYFKTKVEPWKITFVDTGVESMTGGRILRIKKFVGNETFMLTYGDGLGDINLRELLKFHKSHKKLATLTAVQPTGRFGSIYMKDGMHVDHFEEKLKGDEAWINGGFFVLDPGIFKYIKDDSTSWENEPIKKLCMQQQMCAYKHQGFWKCMDTLRDKIELERLWSIKKARWAIWND